MRVLMVLRHNLEAPVPRLDAEVSIGGRYGPGETVVLRMYGRLALHAESVTLPLLAPDAPVVAWWYSETPEVIAYDPLGVFADRRITNVIRDPDPSASLGSVPADYAPGDTDLTWTVITPWRAALASAFDTVHVHARRAWSCTATRPTRPPSCSPAGSPRDWTCTCRSSRTRASTSPSVRRRLRGRPLIEMRNEGYKLVMSRPDQMDSIAPFPARSTGDLLAEELRRLDVDESYAEALGAVTGERPQRAPVGPHAHLARPRAGAGGLTSLPEVVVLPSADALAADVAARLAARRWRPRQRSADGPRSR